MQISRKIISILVLLSLLFVVSTNCNKAATKDVKKGVLDTHKSTTIGQAFDYYQYFKKVKWKTFKTENGQKIIQVNGIIDLKKAMTLESIKNLRTYINQINSEARSERLYDTPRMVVSSDNLPAIQKGTIAVLKELRIEVQFKLNVDESIEIRNAKIWLQNKKVLKIPGSDEISINPSGLRKLFSDYLNDNSVDIWSDKNPIEWILKKKELQDILTKIYENEPLSEFGFLFYLGSVTGNYMTKDGRTKIAVRSVKSDMRSIATAIEAYYVDNNEYPAMAVGAEGANSIFAEKYPNSGSQKICTFRLRGDTQLATITTPISYITSYFSDAFADSKGTTYGYRQFKHSWIMISYGPDRDENTTAGDHYNRIPVVKYGYINGELCDLNFEPTFSLSLSIEQPSFKYLATNKSKGSGQALIYDPTNGTFSEGDIVRIKQ